MSPVKATVMYILALLLIALVPAKGRAEQKELDFKECAEISGLYHANPFGPTMRQLDTLQGCISWQIRQTALEKKQGEENRAIDRNFSRGDSE
ncbi:MAG: hypothetical protein PSX71_13995 [bacterium]|nr:hypothetical protein [bacterium]